MVIFFTCCVSGAEKRVGPPEGLVTRPAQYAAYQTKPVVIPIQTTDPHLEHDVPRAVNTYSIPEDEKRNYDHFHRVKTTIPTKVTEFPTTALSSPTGDQSVSREKSLPDVNASGRCSPDRGVPRHSADETVSLESLLYTISDSFLSSLTKIERQSCPGGWSPPSGSTVTEPGISRRPPPPPIELPASLPAHSSTLRWSPGLLEGSSSPSGSPPSPSPLWGRSPQRRQSEVHSRSGSLSRRGRSRSPPPRHRWSGSESPSSHGDSDSEESDSDYIR